MAKARLALLTAAAVLTAGRGARADDAPTPTEACVAAHVAAQREQRAGKLLSARASARTCARPECPAVIVEECTAMFAAAEKALPSVVFRVKDERGADVVNAKVFDGDALIAERLDGKSVEVDPGEHRFRVEREGAPPVTQTVLVREGESLRTVAFGDDRASTGSSGGASISPAFWVLGATGLVGLGLFAGLGGAGLAKRGELVDAACAPDCDSGDVDAVRGLFLGADISLGLGVASLAAATLVYFLVPGPSGSASALRIDVSPRSLGLGWELLF